MRVLAGLRPPATLRDVLRRGDAANRRQAWSEAEAAYRDALARDPTLAAIWVQYGHALKEQGKLHEAEEAYRRSLALRADVADTHLQLGHVLKLRQRPDEAADAYLSSYRLDGALPYPALELSTLDVALPATPPRSSDQAGAAPAAQNAASHSAEEATSCPVCTKLAAEYGLNPDVLRLFDARYYFYAHAAVRQAVGTPNVHACLAHFCQVGIRSLYTFAPDLQFDASFYSETYIGYQITAENAYWHWLGVGIGRSALPNPESWVRDLLDDPRISLRGIDFDLYRGFFYPTEVKVRWVDLFTRFVDEDILRPGPHLPITAETVEFFIAVAGRFEVNEEYDSAARLYGRVLLDVPQHRRGLDRYAKFLIGRQQFLEALQLYNKAAKNHPKTPPRLLGQAQCYEALGDYQNALRILRDGQVHFPAVPDFLDRLRALSDKFLHQRWNEGIALGVQGEDDRTQQLLHDACAFLVGLIPISDCLPIGEIKSVAIVGVHSVPQCYFYRIEQKTEQLEAAGYQVEVFDVDHDLLKFFERLQVFDAVIFYRVPAWGKVIEAVTRARELGCATFYDMDDLIFTDEDFPDRFESFGGLISREDHVGLKLGVPLYRTAMSLCDYGIASTPLLARQMAGVVRTGRVYVHRNGFGRTHERYAADATARPDNDRVIIFYGSGTKSHKEDFQELVQPALIEAVRRHGDRIKIVLAGYNVLTEELRSIEDNLCLIDPLWDYHEYWAVLRNVDINLAVLKPNLMTDCKSEIKWLEAALFGVPSIVSGSAVYRDIVDPGSSGLICDTVDDWIAALELLINDPERRREIGDTARRRVIADYGLDRMSYNLRRIMDDVARPPAHVRPVILIVNVFYPPLRIGGVTRLVEDHVARFRDKYASEFDVEIFTTHIEAGEEYKLKAYVQDGVRVVSMGLRSAPDADAPIDDVSASSIFDKFLETKEFSLVHFHCIQGLTASIVEATRERAIPYIISLHDGWWISEYQFIVDRSGASVLYKYDDPIAVLESQGVSAYTRLMKLRRPLFGASALFAVSAKLAQLYTDCGVPNVSAIENGISDLPRVERRRSSDARVRLGFVGGLVNAKGFDLIRYALLAGNYRHLRLCVVETARDPGDVRSETWNTTPVDFIPKVTEAEIGQLYGNIDVLLAPSVCIESYGLATREALHFGCWVIASDRGSIGDCVTEGQNGFVIDVSDPAALINILRLIDDSPERFLEPPELNVVFRKSYEQADDLAGFYKGIIDKASSARASAA